MPTTRGDGSGVFVITAARRGLTEDVEARQRRYVLSMSLRTVCFLLAVLAEGPLRFLLLLGAIGLPYIAVVVANAGRSKAEQPPSALLHAPGRSLPERESEPG